MSQELAPAQIAYNTLSGAIGHVLSTPELRTVDALTVLYEARFSVLYEANEPSRRLNN